MSNPQRVVLLASAAAGVLVLLVLGFTAVDVAGCHAEAEHGGLDLCGLGWFIGGGFAVLIGIVWLIVVAIVAIDEIVRRHRGS